MRTDVHKRVVSVCDCDYVVVPCCIGVLVEQLA